MLGLRYPHVTFVILVSGRPLQDKHIYMSDKISIEICGLATNMKLHRSYHDGRVQLLYLQDLPNILWKLMGLMGVAIP